jgi:hypothetical protein
MNKKLKEYIVNWVDEVTWEIKVKAKNKEEIKKKFFDGTLLQEKKRKVVDEVWVEDSLEIFGDEDDK